MKWAKLCGSLNILWYCPFSGIGMKTDLFQSCKDDENPNRAVKISRDNYRKESEWIRLKILAMDIIYVGFLCGSAGKESACNVGALGSISGLGRSPGEGRGYPFQYSGLENSTDCMVHGVAKSWTRLSDFHFYHICIFTHMHIWWNAFQPLKK